MRLVPIRVPIRVRDWSTPLYVTGEVTGDGVRLFDLVLDIDITIPTEILQGLLERARNQPPGKPG